jgi:hypothetical protein
MSADLWIVEASCEVCGRHDPSEAEVNITYNLTPMLKEAGFVGWSALRNLPARVAGHHILAVLDGMATDPERWRAMNPDNKWGDYDKCLQGRLRAFAEACLTASVGARIGASL